MKTRKTIAKRIKKTKSGKLLHKTCGQNHFNAKESGKIKRNKRNKKTLSKSLRKTISQHI
ncbi:50S ribosomal protein L35 [Patescibacteria group bacterium]|nr:50S ribosomal protein L35 [Patescibacteria group bacterium]